MDSFIEPLYKSPNLIKFGWKRETGAVSYKIYVGTVSSSLSLIVQNIPDIASKEPVGLGKVTFDIAIEDVRALLSLSSSVSFLNKIFYFAITYVDSLGAESDIADSSVVEVPPTGITPREMKDDPTIRRQGFVYNTELMKWVKMAGSSSGAVLTDPSDFYKANNTTDYTYDGTNVSTTLSYLSDATVTGSPAKLTTYTYSGSQVTKIQITDSTVG